MDLARRVYSRELKLAAMRDIDNGRTIAEVARLRELSPKLLERWRGEWRARGELAFPGQGRQGVSRAGEEPQRIGELERKVPAHDGERLLKKACAHFRDHHPPSVVSGEVACLKKSAKRPSKAGGRP